MCCPLLGYFLNTNSNYTVDTEQKQMQADKSLISQRRQGKLVPVIAVTPNETSVGFPASDPHPVGPYPDFNCTRSGCSLFSCVGVEAAATSSGHTPHRMAEHSHPTHMAITSLWSWPTTVALQRQWVLRSGAAIGTNNGLQYLSSFSISNSVSR